jgi:small GTP-binding protein
MLIQKKVCLLGDFAVGKTSLIQRYVYNQFSENYLTTIGVHITKKEITLGSDSIVLIIWDLAGDDGLQKVAASYLAGAAGAVFVGDLSRPETIGDIPSQMRAFEEVNPGSSSVIAFNKKDLLAGPVDVQETARRTGISGDIPAFLTSCRTGENVERAFASLASRLLD